MEPASRRPIRVIISHPDSIRLALFARSLHRQPDFEVIESTTDLFVATDLTLHQLPDVLALAAEGERLPLLVRRIVDEAPSVAVLILEPTISDFTALAEGAIGALPAGSSELPAAIRSAFSYESVISTEWAAALLTGLDDFPDHIQRAVSYTTTEIEVLTRLADGETARDIAESHEVPERLVQLHSGYAVVKYQRAIEALRFLAVNAGIHS